MRRPPRYLQGESERTGAGGHQPAAGRFRDHRHLTGVPAAQGGVRPQPAVLLAHHAVQREAAFEAQPALPQRLGDREVGGQPGLHVAGAATVQDVPGNLCLEGIGVVPLGRIADRDDIDVALQHQGRHLLAVDPGGAADHPVTLAAIGLHAGEVRRGVQLVELELPAVHGQVELGEPSGEQRLQLGLGGTAGHRRHPHQFDQGLDQPFLVESRQHAGLGIAPVAHPGSLGGVPGCA